MEFSCFFMLARIHRPCAVQMTSKMYKKWKGRPGAKNGFSGGAVSELFFRSAGLPNCHKAKKATFGAVPVISSKQRFRMEGALLFSPPSLKGLPRGPLKIPVGSPRGADWCSHAGETLVFLKSERFAYTRTPSSISGNAVFAPGQPPGRKN